VRFVLLLVAAALAGCAGDAVRPDKTIPAATAADVAAIDHWRIDGRIAIQKGDEGYSASLYWLQRLRTFQLRLVAPLGRGTYELSGNEKRVALSVPDGGRFVAPDAATLMREHLGWSIPVAGAEFWLRGLIAPSSEPNYVRRDEAGQLTDLEQDGWRVSILRRTAVDGVDLPAKLFMHYGDLKVRIVINAWNLNPV